MSKLINEVIGNTSLSEKTNGVVAGNYKGYNAVVNLRNRQGYTLDMDGVPSEISEDINLLIVKIRDKKAVMYCMYLNNSVKITFKMGKTFVASLHECMDEIAEFFTLNGYRNLCFGCAGDVQTSLCQVQGEFQYLCEDCFSRKSEEVGGEKAVDAQRKSNLPLGILGAFLGTIPGVILWVIVAQIGFIAGIVGLVIALGSLKGYELLGKKMSKTGVIVAVIFSAVMLLVAQMIAYLTAFYSGFMEGAAGAVTLSQAMELIPIDIAFRLLVEDSEVFAAIIKDVLIGYGFTALVTFTTFMNKYKKCEESFKAERFS